MSASAKAVRADIESAMALLCPQWRWSDVAIEGYLSGGYRNRNYRLIYSGERFVLRIAELPSAMNFALERDRLMALAEVLPRSKHSLELNYAPLVAAHTGRGLLLTRWIDAPLLAETAGVSAETLGTYLVLLHQSLSDLPASQIETSADGSPDSKRHNSTIDEPAQPGALDVHIRKDLALACGSASRADELLQNLPVSAHENVLCHLDLNPWNLLTDGKKWVTLDWETLSAADPLFDLVALCDGYVRARDLNHRKESFTSSALKTYSRIAQRSFADDALAEARVVYQWREYAWAASQIVQGNSRDEIVAQREHFGRLLVAQGFNVLPG